MYITIDSTELRNILEVASKISTKHITLPILQCVLFEVSGKNVCIKATNLEIGIEGTLTAIESEEDGVVAVPANILLQTLHLISQKVVTLSTEGDILHIETQTSKTDIKTIPPEEFPHIPHITGDPITLNSELFVLGIKTTAGAASQSSIKPELGSIYLFQKKEHSLTFVATDSFRLMEKTIPQKGLVLNTSLLIPYKNALELARVSELTKGEIILLVGENQCSITAGNIYITSRLITGNFPDYEQIIPKEYTSTVTTLTQDVVHALKKTNIFLNKFMQLTVTVSKEALTLSSQSNDFGTTTESIPAVVKGDEITLNFNQRYVSEVLGHITDESILLKFAGVGRPLVIENVHNRSIRYLVMPMNK